MKEQWRNFLEQGNWPYDIVPNLVARLADAMDAGNDDEINDLLGTLYYQGVTIDDNGNLCYLMDYLFGNIN